MRVIYKDEKRVRLRRIIVRLTVETNVAIRLPERVLSCTHVSSKVLRFEILKGELHVGGVAVAYFLRLLAGRVDQKLVVEAPEVDSVGEGVYLTLQGDRGVDRRAHQLVGYVDHRMDCRAREKESGSSRVKMRKK